jgi:hypothetical protein
VLLWRVLKSTIARDQEGLQEEQTIAAYRTIYFPAQELYFTRDDPKAAAALILVNNARILDGAVRNTGDVNAPVSGRRRIYISANGKAL